MKTRLILAIIVSLHGANAQTIEAHNHSTTGYVKSDGTIENSSHSTIGYIRQDGTVENASHSTIGYATGAPKESAAVVFFFFKFK
jgi:hypothetical protein